MNWHSKPPSVKRVEVCIGSISSFLLIVSSCRSWLRLIRVCGRWRHELAAMQVLQEFAKVKFKTKLNKNVFCYKTNPIPSAKTRQFIGYMVYRGSMVTYIFTLLLLLLHCCWASWSDGTLQAARLYYLHSLESSNRIFHWTSIGSWTLTYKRAHTCVKNIIYHG